MSIVRTKLTLKNPKEPGLDAIEVTALVDTGSLHLCLPEHVALQLRLEALEEREVTMADGRRRRCPYVGPVEVHFGKRGCFVGAMVLGEEVLLGAVPMEDMDILVSPATHTVIINPASPNFASTIVKRPLAASTL
jgi:clan AA aspartic protease